MYKKSFTDTSAMQGSSGTLIAGWLSFAGSLRAIKSAACVLLAALILQACEPSQERRAEMVAIHIKQANSYKNSGQYRAATIEAKNVIQKSPDDDRGYTLLAGILVELGQFKSALVVLDQAPEENRGSDYRKTRIEALLGRGKYSSALAELDGDTAFSSEQPTQALLLEARARLGLDQQDAARDTYQRVLKQIPQNTQALLGLADIAILKGELEAARALLRQANEIADDNVDIGLLHAKISIAEQDYAAAENHLSGALIKITDADTITPKKATILSALAEVLVKQGRSAEALIYTQILADAFPGFEVAQEKYREALASFQAGELDSAGEHLEELLGEFPNFENATMLLAIIKYQQGDFELASNYLNETVDPELVHPEITRLAALSNLRSNRPRQVMGTLEAYAGTQKDAKLLVIYGTAALMEEQVEKGLGALEQAIALDPTATQAYLALAGYYDNKTEPDANKALGYLRAAYSRTSDSNDASNDQQYATLITSLVRQLLKTGQVKEAETLVNEQLAERNEDVLSLQLAGAFYATQSQFDKARNYYERVLKAAPDNYAAALQLGGIAQRGERPHSEVLAAYARAAGIAPARTAAYQRMLRSAKNDAEVGASVQRIEKLTSEQASATGTAVLATYFAARGELVRAEQKLAQLTTQNIDQALLERTRLAVHYASASRSFSAGDYAEAKQQVFAALRIQPKSLRLLATLAEIEIASENYIEVEKLVEQIGGLDKVLSQQLAGSLHEARNEPDQAIAAYIQAWNSRPGELLGTRLYALLEQHQPANAASFLQTWVKANPDSVAGLALRSRDMLVAGNFKAAISLMEQVRDRSPGNVTNLNNLAWAYQQVGNPQAAAVAAEAYQLAPDTAAIADTYGWILYQSGQRGKAIEILERAAQLDGDNTEIAEHLAEAKAGART